MTARESVGPARDRYTAFGLTWLAYATYYLGRKGFGAAKKTLVQAMGMSEAMLGWIDTLYLAAYAVGQFGSGYLGDRFGPRRLVGYGMLALAAICFALGSVNGALLFGALYLLNGLAQSTGWPGTARAMAEWTLPHARSKTMGYWVTCYQVGPLAAGVLAGELVERFGWRAAFHAPALAILVVAILVLWLLKRGPVGVPADTEHGKPQESEHDRLERRRAQRAVLGNPTLWSFGASYCFIKFIRYVLFFWLPYFLTQTLGYGTARSTWVAAGFEAGGILGVIGIGTLSSRVRLSQAALSALSLLGLGVALTAYVHFGGASAATNVLLFAAVGALLYAPDSMLSATAVLDAADPRAAATATGFVNGLGSLGAIATGLVVPQISERWGWQSLFPTLVVLAFAAALALAPALLRRT